MDKRIPFLDLSATYQELKPELDAAYERVMTGGWYILGEEVARFEGHFASFCGAYHCVGVGNGLEALELVLKAWGVGEGDEVIVPANTYIASWLAISNTGAKPVPVEPDARSYNLDPRLIEAAITPRTKAIMPVHLYGQSAEMVEIMAIARKQGLMVLEDSAQMHLPDRAWVERDVPWAAGFSFYPGKNLGAYGDAGAIITQDDDLADKLRVLRNYGSRKKYYNEVKGHNSRLDALQAALLDVRLFRLNEWNARRARIAELYLDRLSYAPNLVLPWVAPGLPHGWHLFPVRHPRRDELQAWLNEKGVDTLIHYPVPPHLSKAYAEMGFQRGDFPITEEIHDTELSLPIGPHLSLEDATQVAALVQEFCES